MATAGINEKNETAKAFYTAIGAELERVAAGEYTSKLAALEQLARIYALVAEAPVSRA